jgi:hypothetical protein
MKVYHASNVVVKLPDNIHSRKYLDFGQGFYVTTLYNQAFNYAQRFLRRKQDAWINTYELNYNLSDWKILTFNSYSREWLEFVMKCRSGEPTDDYDMVIGGIANDKVIETLTLFFDNLISMDDALGRLKYEKPNIQYCIRSEKMMKECLSYIDAKKI